MSLVVNRGRRFIQAETDIELAPAVETALIPSQRDGRTEPPMRAYDDLPIRHQPNEVGVLDPVGRGATPVAQTHRAERSEPERRHVTRLRVADAAMAVTAGLASYGVRFGAEDQTPVRYLVVSIAFVAVWLVLVASMRAYEPRFLHRGMEEYKRILHAGVALALLGSVASYSLKLEFARGYLLALVVLATGLTLALRLALRGWLNRQRSSGSGWVRRVVVAGHDEDVRHVVDELGRSRRHGYQVTHVCLADDQIGQAYGVPVTSGLDRIAEAAAGSRADAVIVLPCRHLGPTVLRRLGWQLEASGTHLLVGATGLMDVATERTTISSVGHLPLLHVNHAELVGARRIAKDVFDRSAAALGLLVIAPVVALLVLAIRVESRGPAIFRQERVGRGDRRFTVLKLRTMTVDAEDRRAELVELNESDGALFKIRNDPRVTRVGRFLRRYSLDELPQLFNVVLGQMSLVGPRPPLPAEVENYEPDVRRRLVVKPGLTGLWQVSGRSDLPWEEAVRLDLRYVDNWSLAMDLTILWRTGRAVLSRSGAY